MFLGSAFMDVLPATLLLIAFTVVGGVIIFLVRKSMKSPPSKTTTFTLSELRKMRDEGTMSEEEFEHAKQLIIDQSR
jgi:hypothetical protein